MAEEGEPLDVFWNQLRDAVAANGRVLTDDLCYQIVDKLYFHCMRETPVDSAFRHIVLIWFQRTVIEIRNQVFGSPMNANTFKFLGQIIVNKSNVAKCTICSESKEPARQKESALRWLTTQLPYAGRAQQDQIEAAANEVSLLSNEAFSKIIEKRLFILPQTAAVIMCYLRNDPEVRQCVFQNDQEFEAACNVEIKDGSMMLTGVTLIEHRNLRLTANLMKIAQKFLTAERAKGRFMNIATQLAEGKIYKTGSGHAVATQRREKLFEIITNVKPIPRPNMTRGDDPEEMNSSEVMWANIADNAIEEDPDVKVTVKQRKRRVSKFDASASLGEDFNDVALPAPASGSRRELLTGCANFQPAPRPIEMTLQTAEVLFNDQPVGHIKEYDVVFDNGDCRVVSLNAVINSNNDIDEDGFLGDELLRHFGGCDDIFDPATAILSRMHDSDGPCTNSVDNGMVRSFSSNGMVRSLSGNGMVRSLSNNGARALARTPSNSKFLSTYLDRQFEDLSLDIGAPEEHIFEFGGGAGNDMKRISSNQSTGGDERSPRKRANNMRRAESYGTVVGVIDAPYERVQQLDIDVVSMIPNPYIRQCIAQDFVDHSILGCPPADQPHGADLVAANMESCVESPGVLSGPYIPPPPTSVLAEDANQPFCGMQRFNSTGQSRPPLHPDYTQLGMGTSIHGLGFAPPSNDACVPMESRAPSVNSTEENEIFDMIRSWSGMSVEQNPSGNE